jgi:demethylmenaquinone methyltransferase/2-methoxy-6-polyprenyl-1,4-benzoquinol methylase
MFDAVAPRYDVLNRLLSLGLDQGWRRATVRAATIHPEDVVLDLGCGTGDLGRRMAGRARVVGVDLSAEMLRVAGRRAPGQHLVQGSAFRLPFRPAAFDAVVSAFLLRNLHDLPAAFAEMARVTSSRARVALLDITEPSHKVLRQLFDAYFSRAAPALGAVVGRVRAYRYLVDSLAQLPPADEVVRLLDEAGFARAAATRMAGGIITLFTGIRR